MKDNRHLSFENNNAQDWSMNPSCRETKSNEDMIYILDTENMVRIFHLTIKNSFNSEESSGSIHDRETFPTRSMIFPETSLLGITL